MDITWQNTAPVQQAASHVPGGDWVAASQAYRGDMPLLHPATGDPVMVARRGRTAAEAGAALEQSKSILGVEFAGL